MDPSIFKDSPSGRLVRTISGQMAFVPAPLPPPLDLGPLTTRLTQAAGLVGELRGIGRAIPNPYLLIDPFQRREAVSSSRIEGTVTSVSDLLMYEARGEYRHAVDQDDAREVLNYRNALRKGIRDLEDIPLCLRLVRDTHKIMLSGLSKYRGGGTPPGELRRDQNWIGGSRDISRARFIPPPPNLVAECLDRLEKFFHENSDGLPPLVRVALLHYQFEAIHPFPDGNGRVGRILIPLYLAAVGEMPQPLLYMSTFFEHHKDDYQDLLFNVSRNGAWMDWIAFFLDGVISQAQDAVSRVRRLQDLQQKYRLKLHEGRASALCINIVDALFNQPYVSIPQVAMRLDVTYAGAQRAMERIRKLDIIAEIPRSSRPKYFFAEEIYAAVYADD